MERLESWYCLSEVKMDTNESSVLLSAVFSSLILLVASFLPAPLHARQSSLIPVAVAPLTETTRRPRLA